MSQFSPVIFDTGSYTVKAGFAHETTPTYHIPSLLGNPRGPRIASQTFLANPCCSYVGYSALQHRGILTLRRPVVHGLMENWEDLETLWRDIYTSTLQVYPEDHSVVFAQNPGTPPKSTRKLLEVAMESLGVNAICIENSSKLALYSKKIVSGVVLDIGDGVTTAVPIFEGKIVLQAVQRNTDLLDRMHNNIMDLLIAKDHLFRESLAGINTHTFKEKCLVIASRNSRQNQTKPKHFQTADGTDMNISSLEACKITQHLFGFGVNDSDAGVDVMIQNAIANSPREIRNVLRGNIFICGGTSNLPGLKDELEERLRLVDARYKVISQGLYQPEDLTWIGAGNLARSWSIEWINKLDYDERGSDYIY